MLYEYSLYSYISDTTKIQKYYHFDTVKFTETIYKKDSTLVFLQEYDDRIEVLKYSYIDKNKNCLFVKTGMSAFVLQKKQQDVLHMSDTQRAHEMLVGDTMTQDNALHSAQSNLLQDITSLHITQNIKYFLRKFGYTQTTCNEVQGLVYKSDLFELTMTRTCDTHDYMVKLSSVHKDAESILKAELSNLEYVCEFIKPTICL